MKFMMQTSMPSFCLTALLFGLAAPVVAQEDDLEARYGVLEEVVSTARKREEPLQETPVASTIIAGETLDRVFAPNLASMPFLAPNVNLSNGLLTNVVYPSIRGYTLTDVDSTFDPPVAIMVNGIYYARPVMNNLDMFDVEQLEILRGPQGTLFGRNTTAGAIQLRTKRPTDEFETSGKITLGKYGRQNVRAAVNLPLVAGQVNARLAAYSLNMDGYYKSAATANSAPRELGKEDKLSVRGTLEFLLNDAVDLTFIGEWHRDNSHIRPQKNYSGPARSLCSNHGFCGVPFNQGDKHDDYDTDIIEPGFVDIDILSITKELNWELARGTVTWLSNYRETDELWVYDADGVGSYDMFTVDRRQPHEQYSTELRFASSAFERMDFIVGLFYFHQEYDLERRTGISSDRLSAPNPDRILIPLFSVTGQKHNAWSVFGELNYQLTDQLTLTVGGRYTDEEKDFYQRTFAVYPNTGPRRDFSQSWDDAGPKFGLRYQFNPEVMAYASYQKGFKSGGFNGRCGQAATCERPFDPEEVDGYEVGLKADLLDNRVRANLALFLTEVTGLQRGRLVALPPGATNPQETVTDNAAKAELKGLELEVSAWLTPALRLDFSLGYLDANYKDFCADIDGAQLYDAPPTSNCGGEAVLAIDNAQGPDAYILDQDNSMFEFQLAPKFNASVSGTYNMTLENGAELTLNASYSYVDDLFTDLTEASYRPSVEIIDASINYQAPSSNYRVSLFGKNLTDEIYVVGRTIVPPLFDYRNVSPPRMWGVEFMWDL